MYYAPCAGIDYMAKVNKMQGFEWDEEKRDWVKVKVPPKPWFHTFCENCRYGNVVEFMSNPPQFGYIMCAHPQGMRGQLRKRDFCSKGETKE